MVLETHNIKVTENALLEKLEPDYGKDFKNLWNPTIAKLAVQYGIETKMYAKWPLFKKDVYPKALAEFQLNPSTMNYLKYENPNDKDVATEPLPLSYKEMFKALDLGCKCVYGSLTPKRIKTLLLQNRLIQTSIKLNLLYQGTPNVFHSLLLYKVEGETVFYHDPTYGANLRCTLDKLNKASQDVGAAIVFS